MFIKFSFFPAYCLGLLIFIAASLPGSDLQKIQEYPDNALLRFFLSDSFMHFLIFGILTFLICYGYRHPEHSAWGKAKERKESVETNFPYLRIGLIGIGYSLFIEIYQDILPWRFFGLDDILWNTVGVIFAASGFYLGHEIN